MKIAGRDAFLKLHWDPLRASHGAIKIAAYPARDRPTFLSGEVQYVKYCINISELMLWRPLKYIEGHLRHVNEILWGEFT